jgi:hypothetical protein
MRRPGAHVSTPRTVSALSIPAMAISVPPAAIRPDPRVCLQHLLSRCPADRNAWRGFVERLTHSIDIPTVGLEMGLM